MKRLIFILTLALSVSSLSGHAEDIRISNQVLAAFNQEFGNASEISWSAVGADLYKVTCRTNGEYISVYYNDAGKMVSLTRNITSKTLPLSLQSSLKKSLENYWITDLTEVNNEEGVFYVATIENGDNRLLLKSNNDSEWYSIRKLSK